MKMKELFDRGEFVVSAEVGPPKGIHVEELVEEAKTYLKGVHAVNVTDNQSSVMRLGSLAMCKVLKRCRNGSDLPAGMPGQKPYRSGVRSLKRCYVRY